MTSEENNQLAYNRVMKSLFASLPGQDYRGFEVQVSTLDNFHCRECFEETSGQYMDTEGEFLCADCLWLTEPPDDRAPFDFAQYSEESVRIWANGLEEEAMQPSVVAQIWTSGMLQVDLATSTKG